VRICVGVSDFTGVRYTYDVCPGAIVLAAMNEIVPGGDRKDPDGRHRTI